MNSTTKLITINALFFLLLGSGVTEAQEPDEKNELVDLSGKVIQDFKTLEAVDADSIVFVKGLVVGSKANWKLKFPDGTNVSFDSAMKKFKGKGVLIVAVKGMDLKDETSGYSPPVFRKTIVLKEFDWRNETEPENAEKIENARKRR